MPVPKKPQQSKKPLKSAKAKRIANTQKIEDLERNVLEFEPAADLKAFNDLPISDNTKRGLKSASFTTMTEIQAQSIPVSLKGKDVLGAARTGSGKTLAFLIPVLEVLYRKRWGPTDGLGALIISPTRELAVQIFQVLRSIGGFHSFSAGLVIGGKNVKDESERLSRMNILVATPGRLLQHMDQTFGFAADNLQLLVLDEADRILDMGFQRTLSALLTHLPKSRQTLLFSATQTRSVHDLARLSLKDPVPIGVDPADGPSTSAAASTETDKNAAASSLSTPQSLSQHYLICPLPEKLSVLFSFIKSHLHSKTIVFLSACKQVRFVFESFCRLHPGIPLIQLHGKQKQTARLTMYEKFTTSKHAVLFATDIAARGLDFPSVDWVLQLDAPEDAETYVHRVGRTARYESKGNALMFLCPSEEEGMLEALKKKGIVVNKIKARESKKQDITNQIQNLAFQDPELKYLGQRAFVSYLKSIHLHKDKSIFKLSELPVNEFAESFGLPGAPKIKFLSREMAAKEKQKKNADRTAEAAKNDALRDTDSDESSSGEEEEEEVPRKQGEPSKEKVRTKYDRMFERKNQDVLSAHYNKLISSNPEADDDDDDFISLKRADHDLSGDEMNEVRLANLSKNKIKLSTAKRKMIMNVPTREKIVFGDDGVGREARVGEDGEEWVKDKGGAEGIAEAGKRYAESERTKMREADVRDKLEAKEKKREKKRKRKEREKGKMNDESGNAVLDTGDFDDDGYVSPEFDLPDESSEDESENEPAPKRRKAVSDGRGSKHQPSEFDMLDDEEELAMKLLSKRR